MQPKRTYELHPFVKYITNKIDPNNKIARAVHSLPKRFLIAIVVPARPVIPAPPVIPAKAGIF
jgi:hypothetical protein